MLGSPWFWRVYIGTLLIAAALMRYLEYELPPAVRQVGLSTVVGVLAFDLSCKWWSDGLSGTHRK
jgi:hypothetical protein